MTYRFELEEEAEVDLSESFGFYSEIDSELATKFILDFEDAVNLILQYPKSGTPLSNNLRRMLLKKFPHYIVYEIIKPNLIIAYAVGHTRRKPGYWRK